MNEVGNPYESPAQTETTVESTTAWSSLIVGFAKTSFWLGLGHAICGSAITFYPGAECGWFALSAILLVPGVFVRQHAYRNVAMVATVLCILYSYSGHQRGIRYHEQQQIRESTIGTIAEE